MILYFFLVNWIHSRPRKLNYKKRGDSTVTPHRQTKRLLDMQYSKLCRLLCLFCRPAVYIRSVQEGIVHENKYQTSEGEYKFCWYRGLIFITYSPAYEKMVFTLAHELYHDYQWRHKKTEFKDVTTIEEWEIQAQGFALAYCETLGRLTSYSNPNKYLPDKISHREFSNETKNKTDERGYPIKVVEYSKRCMEKFDIESFIKTEEHIAE